jgi:hypothetical protein
MKRRTAAAALQQTAENDRTLNLPPWCVEAKMEDDVERQKTILRNDERGTLYIGCAKAVQRHQQ